MAANKGGDNMLQRLRMGGRGRGGVFILLLFLQRGGELKPHGLHDSTHPSEAESTQWNGFTQEQKQNKTKLKVL